MNKEMQDLFYELKQVLVQHSPKWDTLCDIEQYIIDLQHQLEEKDKVIKDLQLDSFIFLKNRINQGMSEKNIEKHLIRIGKNIINNLERGKNGN